MKFEKLEINQCQNKDCNQKFTLDNIKLAVWLHGVILLTQGRQPMDDDPLLPPLPSVNKMETTDTKLKDYVGLTCPKCLETSLYQGSYQDIREFKYQLQTMVHLSKPDLVEKIGPFRHDLKYYSPVDINLTERDHFDVESYGFDDPERDFEYFETDFQVHILGEMQELWDRFCSYISDGESPAGPCTVIHWFKEEEIFELLRLEKEKQERIFPRYHYHTDLVRRIDSLSKYNHKYGKIIDEAKAEYKNFIASSLEQSGGIEKFEPPLFKDFLKEKQRPIASSPNLIGNFLEVLISEPITLKAFLGKPNEDCDYLWSKFNPFHGKEYPEIFPAELELETEKKILQKHSDMVARVKNNSTKKYVQDFLKDNLVDFLEEYEGLIQSNQFSYAHIWRLKENFLKELFEVTNEGLRGEKPFSCHYDTGWVFRFNDKVIPIPEKGYKGLIYVHFLLCNKNKPFSCFELDKVDGIDPALCAHDKIIEFNKPSQDDYSKLKGKKKQDIFDVNEMMDDKGLAQMKKEKSEIEKALAEAEKNNDLPKIEEVEHELDKFITHFSDYWIPKRKAKKQFSAKEVKTIREKIEKSISRTILNIKSHDPKLFQHLAQSIHGLPKAFYRDAGITCLHLKDYNVMYRPDPDIDWHLD